jgi:hypothetical protein
MALRKRPAVISGGAKRFTRIAAHLVIVIHHTYIFSESGIRLFTVMAGIDQIPVRQCSASSPHEFGIVRENLTIGEVRWKNCPVFVIFSRRTGCGICDNDEGFRGPVVSVGQAARAVEPPEISETFTIAKSAVEAGGRQ